MPKTRFPILLLLHFLSAPGVHAQPGKAPTDVINRPIRPVTEGSSTPFHAILTTTFNVRENPGGGIVIDPRKNAVSYRTEGSGPVGYTATVRAEWTNPRAVTIDPNVVLPQALES